jgi:hypothetical protein
MEVNNVFYESTAIGHHYRSKKSLALAYLMTIGSKALVLTEVSGTDADNVAATNSNTTTVGNNNINNLASPQSNGSNNSSPSSGSRASNTQVSPQQGIHAQVSAVQKSFDDEAAIQRKILHEEQVQQFQRALDDKPGVSVLKKGRNGEFRHIYIRVKDDVKRGCKAVVWHSRMGSKKSFALDPSMSVTVAKQQGHASSSNNSPNTGTDSNSSSPSRNNNNNGTSSSSNHSNQDDHHHHNNNSHPASFQANVPILTLGNVQRKLVIQFMTANECNVCLHLLQALGVKDPNLAAVTGSPGSGHSVQ